MPGKATKYAVRGAAEVQAMASVFCRILVLGFFWPINAIAQADAGPDSVMIPGQLFRDCPACPEMVVVPEGTFVMGSPESEVERLRFLIDEKGEIATWAIGGVEVERRQVFQEIPEDLRLVEPEGPQRYVALERPFAVAVNEVTFAQWDACARAGGCAGMIPDNEGWGRGTRPVINVSWEDAQAYVDWLSGEIGAQYRLPSEAEWEYAARAATETARFWGDGHSLQCQYANGADSSYLREVPDEVVAEDDARCLDGYPYTAPARSFDPNRFGLHDMLGNVSEWTLDCWNERYRNAPVDAGAWLSGDCSRRVTRGGSWINRPGNLRAANRFPLSADIGYRSVGFRVVRALGAFP